MDDDPKCEGCGESIRPNDLSFQIDGMLLCVVCQCAYDDFEDRDPEK